MKKIKSLAMILILSVLAGTINTQSVWASSDHGSLSYWYSNSSDIGYWSSSPNMSSEKLNSNSAFYYASALAEARSQWNSALSLSISISSSSEIDAHGGTLEELLDIGYAYVESNESGICYYNRTYSDGYYTYQGTQKNLFCITDATIVIVDNGRTLSEYKETATHELGHALGYNGHNTSSSTSVMYATAHSNYTLSSQDKRHLQQVY